MEFSPEFIRRLQRREQQAFSELYTSMVDRLYRYIAGRYHLDRQGMYDLIGDFFVKLRDRIDRVDPKQPLEPRVWTVFRNFVADYFKTKKHAVRLDWLEDILKDTGIDPLQQAQNATQLKRIYSALDQLDDLSKEIVILRYVEDLSFDEITMITGLQADAVRQRASRSIKKIQELLR
jgi:RNA polymerase sigma-70 factor, ECF subfamily